MTRQEFLKVAAATAVSGAAVSQAQQANPDLGFKDTPMEPGMPWHVHDPDRPHPRQITPAATPGGAPSDAVVLFDGKDLSKWYHPGRGANSDARVDAAWKVENGYFEITPGFGNLLTRDKFGDVQLHVEWASPAAVTGRSQGRGNSGVMLLSRYEIQVLDAWQNPTYADGGPGAMYGQWPPLVTPARRPGEWNTYDIVFETPQFDAEKLVKPAFFTVFYNGVMVHNRKQSLGPMVYRQAAHYTPHPSEDSLLLQDHNSNPVRYRNIWIRRLSGYDQA
jgi:hypothetical protein